MNKMRIVMKLAKANAEDKRKLKAAVKKTLDGAESIKASFEKIGLGDLNDEIDDGLKQLQTLARALGIKR